MARPLTARPFEAAFRGGQGEPLVLLHGGTATWHAWQSTLPHLTLHHEVLAPTLPGHLGGPALPPGVVTIASYADGVEAAMDEAGFETAHLAGNSLGGWTAMELARRGRARSVVALSPAGGWPVDDRRVRRIFVSTARQVRLGRPFLPFVMRFPVARRLGFHNVALRGDRLSAADALQVLEGVLRTDYDQGLPIFDDRVLAFPDPGVPVVVAWSEHDRLLTQPRYSDAWRVAVPHATWVTLPGVGHVPMFDDPQLVARTILAHTLSAGALAEDAPDADTT